MSKVRVPRSHLSKKVAAAGLTAAAVGGGLGIAQAAVTGSSSSSKIYACYSTKTNALYHLNYPTHKVCPGKEKLISWSQAGPQGARGKTGATGSQGKTGPQGAVGAQGPQGSQGFTGAQGSQGSTGAQGPQGSQGFTGAQGSQGSTGAQGPQGSQGSTGAQGAPGAVAEYNDYYKCSGSSCEVTTTPVRLAYVVPKTDSSGYFNVNATVEVKVRPRVAEECWVAASKSSVLTSPTPKARVDTFGVTTLSTTLAVAGVLKASPSTLLGLFCKTSPAASALSTSTGSAFNAALTAVRVNSASGSVTGSVLPSKHKLANRFVRPVTRHR